MTILKKLSRNKVFCSKNYRNWPYAYCIVLVQRCIVYYIILYLYELRINDAYRMEVLSYRTNKQSTDIRKGESSFFSYSLLSSALITLAVTLSDTGMYSFSTCFRFSMSTIITDVNMYITNFSNRFSILTRCCCFSSWSKMSFTTISAQFQVVCHQIYFQVLSYKT